MESTNLIKKYALLKDQFILKAHQKIKSLDLSHPKWLILFFLVLVAINFKHVLKGDKNGPGLGAEAIEQEIATDTFIPLNHTLVPIEISNFSAFSSIVGDFALVDLFAAGYEGEKTKAKLASNIKVVRSPQNPETFGALIPDSEPETIKALTKPVFAVIKNPKNKSSKKKQSASKNHRTIEYGE